MSTVLEPVKADRSPDDQFDAIRPDATFEGVVLDDCLWSLSDAIEDHIKAYREWHAVSHGFEKQVVAEIREFDFMAKWIRCETLPLLIEGEFIPDSLHHAQWSARIDWARSIVVDDRILAVYQVRDGLL